MPARLSFIGIGAVCGFLAVASGAFGAHALSGKLSDHMLKVFELAADYLLAHALALVLIGVLIDRHPAQILFYRAGTTMLTGICLFSGSLFVLSLSDARWLGMVTPMGGMLLLAGWLLLARAAFKQRA